MVQITVIITTDAKREEKLRSCIASIRASQYTSYRLLVVQLTDAPILLPSCVDSMQVEARSVSVAKNEAVATVTTPYVAFVDDDCIVSKAWLSQIVAELRSFRSTAAVYGSVFPYAPKKHIGEYCPSFMMRKKTERMHTFHIDATHFGIGCNVAYRVKTLRDIGGYATWLGPGTPAAAAEDIELAYRFLTKGYTLSYVPKARVWHDRWLSYSDYRRVYWRYNRGLVAAYGAHTFLGGKGANFVVRRFFTETAILLFRRLRGFWHSGMFLKMYYDIGDVLNGVYGLIIAMFV